MTAPIELSAAERAGVQPPCSACLSAEDEREGAIVATGLPVVRCTNPTTCRLRAQRAGIWSDPAAIALAVRC